MTGSGSSTEAEPDGVLREELARLLAATACGAEHGSDPGAGAGPDALDACDVLDVLWIARLSGLGPLDWTQVGAGQDPMSVTAPSPSPLPEPVTFGTHATSATVFAPPTAPGPGPAADPAPEPVADPDPGPGREPAATERRTARLHLPARPSTAPPAPGSAYAIRVAQPAALPDVLSLTRALRPLRQTVPSARARTLDVPATAAASGDTGLLLPVLRPAAERRFSVDLLVDAGTTMTVWHRLAGELRTLLERHGAFADVRAWALHTDGPEPSLAPFRRGTQARSATRRWRESLYDPTGRRVVLVLTDGVGPAWYGTELPETLAHWSRQRPVAALQVLPSRLWHRTALRTAAVRARGSAAPRATIEVGSSAPLPGIARGRAGSADRARVNWLPVLEVSEQWLGPWARLVSGRTSDWTPLRAVALTVVDRPARATAADEPGTPAEWIERFEAGYTPDAFRLLRLLAAAPLSLPVMRLVQRTLLPASTPMHLAELFLSGLLVRRTPVEQGEDPDTVVYDFRDGVRDALLARMTRTESLRVLRQVVEGVSERVAETLGGVTDFAALMAAAGEEGGGRGAVLDGLELPEDSRAFAEVALAVIGGAGGDYRWLAERLAGGAEAPGAGSRESGESGEREEPAGGGLVRGLLRWSARRLQGGAKPDVPVPQVETRIPERPTPYIVREEALAVLAVLRRGAPSAVERYPVEPVPTCVIEGPSGVGKTALAIDCAREAVRSGEFTMVRWIRAGSRWALHEDLQALAAELGLVRDGEAADSLPVALNRLHSHLRKHPGWLLIYDGVSSEHFLPADYWLPQGGYGSLLVTLAEAAPWDYMPCERVRLGEFTHAEAMSYLRRSLDDEYRELWQDNHELSDLVAVTRRRPHDLMMAVRALKTFRQPVRSRVEHLLTRREEGLDFGTFLDFVVWISRDGVFLGTGVLVETGDVITTVIDDLSTGIEVHRRDGSRATVAGMYQANRVPQLTLLRTAALSPRPTVPALPTSGADVVAAWYAPPANDRATPLIQLRPGSAELQSLPRGTALIDTQGALRALVAASADGTAKTIEVTSELLDDLAAGIQARGRPPLTPPPARETPPPPYFYLSAPGGGGPGEARFFRDLTGEIARLTPAMVSRTGFLAEQELRGGENWEERAKLALASARVFVPLYSRQYFASEWCGKEWDAFNRRRQLTPETDGVSAIVPVLWAGTDQWRRPLAARTVPYIDPNFGSRYPAEGLARLMDTENRFEYWHVVRRIASVVVNAAESTSLTPCDISLFDDLRNAFDDSGWWG